MATSTKARHSDLPRRYISDKLTICAIIVSAVLDLSIIIPFKDKAHMTVACLESLISYGDEVKEIILVSNNSEDNELEIIRTAADSYKNVKVIIYNHPFNFQAINNWAGKQGTGKVLLLLNNDIELVEQSKGLLRKMYDQALKKTTGAVGCLLLYEDQKTIQHAGVYLIAGGTADNLYIGRKYKTLLGELQNPTKPLIDIRTTRTVTAVTAAAVMVERTKFTTVGGLNEDFIICGGDVDLCLRLEERGYKSVLIGANEGYMVHKESKSRSMLAVPYIDFVESYKSYIKHFDVSRGDPYFSQEELRNAK